MLTATVTGSVWATRRLDEIPKGAFLEVEADVRQAADAAHEALGSPG